MSGLSYLCEYGDSDESDIENKTVEKVKLPTPDLSKVAVISEENYVDDPQLHGNRLRTFPHVRGNWATYVYLKYPKENNLRVLIEVIQQILTPINETCYLCEDLHISISKTVVLKYHMISTFIDSLREAFVNVDSFELSFDSVQLYVNEDNTRTFIALKADVFSQKYLLRSSKIVDGVFGEFLLPKFYDDPSFHMSILWFNGNCKKEITKFIEKLNNILSVESENSSDVVSINKVHCKIGNKYYQFHLD